MSSSLFRRSELLVLLVLLAGVGVVAKWHKRDTLDNFTACQENVKTIGTALEMYSTDWSGHYPSSLQTLVPNYIPEIPACPAACDVTYTLETGAESPHNINKFADYYYVFCAGHFHEGQAEENLPFYETGTCTTFTR